MICWHYDSPIGKLTLAEENGALVGLWMENQKYFPILADCSEEKTPLLTDVCRWLDRYFAGDKPRIGELPLAPKGSPFRLAVWEILKTIPYGKTMTYGEIARHLEAETGLRQSAQAVGGAVGHNPIGIVIPCHRVLGADGSLTGYAGGLERKKYLLKLEVANGEDVLEGRNEIIMNNES